MPDNDNNNTSFYQRHEGQIIGGIGVLVFVLAGAVITNFVSTELEKERSKDEDKRFEQVLPIINKVNSIEAYGKDTREWVRTINNRNVNQLQMINDLKTELARVQEKLKCNHKEGK